MTTKRDIREVGNEMDQRPLVKPGRIDNHQTVNLRDGSASFRATPKGAQVPRLQSPRTQPIMLAAGFVSSRVAEVFRKPLGKVSKNINPIIERLGRRRVYRGSIILGSLAAIFLIFSVISYIHSNQISRSYHLSVAEQALIGKPDQNLLAQFKYDPSSQAYYLAKTAIKTTTGSSSPSSPLSANSVSLGDGANTKPQFSLKLPVNAAQGITTYDDSSNLSFTLIPKFNTLTAKQEFNHTVYPIGLSGAKAVYTIKHNGVQEDIVYDHAPKGEIKLQYQLKLPSTLAARMMPGGNLGIYSASSLLFGNISYGSPADQQRVQAARKNAVKDNLVFVIPAPQIISASGAMPSRIAGRAKLSFKNGVITIVASNLSSIRGPISIDPSVVVTSVSNFMTNANVEGDITFDSTNNQITEAGLTGGGLSGNTNSCGVSWCASSTSANTGFSLPSATSGASAVAYNGYIYFMGGFTTAAVPTVDYAALSANGSLAAPPTCAGTQETDWCESSTSANTNFSLPTSTYDATASAVAYNGYIYFMGGFTTAAVPTVDYAALSANGSLAAPPTCAGTQETDWCESSTSANTNFSLPTSTYDATAVDYNGYIYFMGGNTGSVVPTVDYVALNANGSLGATGNCAGTQETDWCESSTTANTNFSLPTATSGASAAVYNGYIYFMGGTTGSAAVLTVDYAPIYNNGSIGAWSATTSLPTATEFATAAVYNGYIYFMGGNTVPTVDYAALSSPGDPTSWTASSTTANTGFSLPVSTQSAATVVYNGYIYFMGGNTGSVVLTVDYAALNANGSFGAPPTCAGTQETDWCQSKTSGSSSGKFGLPTATSDAAAAVYNGYIYFMGGTTGSTVPTVDYVALNANGSLAAPPTCAGTQTTFWCESSTTANTNFSLPSATTDAASAVYNGYIYFMGGNTGSIVPTVDYVALNANGSLAAPPTCAGTQETDWCESSTSANTNFSLPSGAAAASAVAYNGYIYFMGGNAVPTVDYVALNANGSLAAPPTCAGTQETDWCESSTSANTNFSLPTATDFASAVAYNGYIYFMGGFAVGAVPTVDYAALNANGSLGAPGNCAGTQETDWCESSTSANTGFSLPSATYSATTAVYNGYIYFMGGNTGSTVPTVDYTLINNGGPATVSAWTASSTTANTGFSLPTATYGASAVVYNGYIYFMGGNGVPTVDYAALNANGSLAAPPTCAGTQETDWCESSTTANTNFSLPTATQAASAVVYNGYIYFMGGNNVTVPTVDYVALSANGSLAAPPTCAGTQETDWCESSTSANTNFSLPTATQAASAVVYNGYIYFMGGFTGSGSVPTVDYVALSANGSLAAPPTCAGTQETDWCESSTSANTNFSLPTSTYSATAAVYNGYIYFMGGLNGIAVPTVDYVALSANGSLTAPPTCAGTQETDWCESSTSANTNFSLPTATQAASAAVYNGYIYFMGGLALSYTPTVYYAPIYNNGSIGAWSTTTSLPTGTNQASAVVYNGYIYFMGGYNGSAAVPTVDYSPLNSMPRIGVYSRLIDLTGFSNGDPTPTFILTNGGDCTLGSLCTTNTSNPGLGGVSGPGGIRIKYRFASNACATLNTPTTLPTGTNFVGVAEPLILTADGCSTTTDIGRYMWVQYILDDSQTATFPDSTGNHTTISDITVYYHPASNYRLRGGATFSNGSLQSLDAQP